MDLSIHRNTRHAHFECDDDDSADDSSPGLQLRTRRPRTSTIVRPPVRSPDDTISRQSFSDVQSNAPFPELINEASVSPSVTPQGLERDSILVSRNSPHPSAKVSALPQRVRMNSQPLAVSLPLNRSEIPLERIDGVQEPMPKGSADERQPQSSPEDEARERKNIEKDLPEHATQTTPTSDESMAKDASPPRSQAAPSRKSQVKETLWNLYNKIKHSHRVSWIIPTVTNFNLMKPVIRSSVSAWIGLVFLLINPILAVEGQSAFFSVVVAFISPPSSPFVQAMEQIVYLWVFVGLAWAWVAICAACISAVRTNYVNPAFLAEVERKYAGLKATNPEQYQRRIVRINSSSLPPPNGQSSCSSFLDL